MFADATDIPGLLATAIRTDDGLSALSPRACAAALGLDSLTLCLLNQSGLELVWYDPADTAAIAFEDLQYTLGQGPTPDAARTGEPVLVPDLDRVPEHRWPALLAATHSPLPRAVQAVPLDLGAVRLGVLTGHRTTTGPLTRQQMSHLLALAEGAITLLTTPHGANDMSSNNPLSLHRALIHQATGALTVLLDIPIDQALARLRAYAFTHDLPLLDVAHEVVHHQANLDKPPN
ncbi:GAF and ANTAR domain-containing protein [Streptomyces spectabilis]|uniref:Transcriptional regulator with GAF, ATPase, and Fis domain n=1 Tax=Streptomyces spectabilis TaxID=68270 RepID=A0A7W8B4G1_STRST|nr:GAF and ANTAR domain-containing protein [Streptomyces spectabilis]MBB5110146.1 transcriptional regulator with GAF, ATPase, and Fis domain [Streptomyces spectabilis]GGV59017.1 GAF domain-containing protein [Streptomyces spectabilis]